MVEDLIDQDTKEWNINLINEIFLKEEADVIRQIPLIQTGRPNKMIWRDTTNGLFNVKSAYYLQGELQERKKGQCSKSPR